MYKGLFRATNTQNYNCLYKAIDIYIYIYPAKAHPPQALQVRGRGRLTAVARHISLSLSLYLYVVIHNIYIYIYIYIYISSPQVRRCYAWIYFPKLNMLRMFDCVGVVCSLCGSPQCICCAAADGGDEVSDFGHENWHEKWHENCHHVFHFRG